MNEDWVKGQFLQQPTPDPWINWTLPDLEAAEKDPSYPEPARRQIRVVIRARRAGISASIRRDQPSGDV